MTRHGQTMGLLLLLYSWLVFPGCGSEESSTDTDPALRQDKAASCETLASRLLEAPLTGSEFHCLWCNREWSWTVPAGSPTLFVLIAFTCDHLRSEAFLEVRDARRSVVWQREIGPGYGASHCIRIEDPPGETLSVRLRGSGELPRSTSLIKEFSGSVYLKVFDERSRLITGPDS